MFGIGRMITIREGGREGGREGEARKSIDDIRVMWVGGKREG